MQNEEVTEDVKGTTEEIEIKENEEKVEETPLEAEAQESEEKIEDSEVKEEEKTTETDLTEENSEETPEEKPEEKSEGTPEEEPEEKSEETQEEKPEEKSEETQEEKPEEKSEETPTQTPEEIAARKAEKIAARKERWKKIGNVLKKVGLTVILPITASVLVIYLVGVLFYSNRLFLQTTVNYTTCSNKTIEQAKKELNESIKNYELKFIYADGDEEVLQGKKIGLRYEGVTGLERVFEKQNPFLWPKAIFEKSDYKVNLKLYYDTETLRVLITELDCMRAEEQKLAVPATIEYKEDGFVICEEQYGTEVNLEKLVQVANQRVQELRPDLDLHKTKSYVQPKFTKDSQKVLDTKKAMNQSLKTEVTFEKDSKKLVLTSKDFASWIYADDEMNQKVDETKLREYINNISQTFNTENESREMTTPDGKKKVTIQNAALGSIVDAEGEVAKITEDIMSGKKIKREPLYSRVGTAAGEYSWGKTYIEVDISAQYMWFVSDGVVRMETPVVTGMKGRMDTPAGIFKVLEKKRNKTLVGQIVNGKPLYRQPVSYWMRITWDGVGFHDASWQPTFGGSRYVTNGSHGCINMPWGKAKELYNMLPYGTTVVIHY